ncbi:hypothetical protein R84B8_00668 [Treponema sp. R8-4-B8]
MGVIKTALEIALEKTENVKGDKSGIGQFEVKKRGKKLANDFLEGEVDLAVEIKKTPAQDRESLKQGIFDVLVAQIALPAVKEDEKKIEKLGKGLSTVINKGEFNEMYRQLTMLFAQYLKEVSQYGQMINQQYAPKLRQKEEELSRRLGREVRIDPFHDPEFVAFYNQNISALKGNYESVVAQAREEAKRMFET